MLVGMLFPFRIAAETHRRSIVALLDVDVETSTSEKHSIDIRYGQTLVSSEVQMATVDLEQDTLCIIIERNSGDLHDRNRLWSDELWFFSVDRI